MAIERLSLEDTVTDSTRFAVSIDGVDRAVLASVLADYLGVSGGTVNSAYFSRDGAVTTTLTDDGVYYPVQTNASGAYNVTTNGTGITVSQKTTGGDSYNYFSNLDSTKAYKVEYCFSLLGTNGDEVIFGCYDYAGNALDPVSTKQITMLGSSVNIPVNLSFIVYGTNTCVLYVDSPTVASTSVEIVSIFAMITELGTYSTNV